MAISKFFTVPGSVALRLRFTINELSWTAMSKKLSIFNTVMFALTLYQRVVVWTRKTRNVSILLTVSTNSTLVTRVRGKFRLFLGCTKDFRLFVGRTKVRWINLPLNGKCIRRKCTRGSERTSERTNALWVRAKRKAVFARKERGERRDGDN